MGLTRHLRLYSGDRPLISLSSLKWPRVVPTSFNESEFGLEELGHPQQRESWDSHVLLALM